MTRESNREMKSLGRIPERTSLLVLLVVFLAACDGGSSSSISDPPLLTSLDPAPNETAAPVNTNITAVFSQTMNAPDSSTFIVSGSQSAKRGGTYLGGGTDSLSFHPNKDFNPGEELEVTLTTGLTTTGETFLDRPFTYRFLAAVRDTGSRGDFVFAAAVPVGSRPISITAGDWEGDGDLDLAVGNRFTFDVTVLLNDGTGGFSESLSSPIKVRSQPSGIVAGDWDGDGDLDLAVTNELTDDVTVLSNEP